jgi:hypothetical protein
MEGVFWWEFDRLHSRDLQHCDRIEVRESCELLRMDIDVMKNKFRWCTEILAINKI